MTENVYVTALEMLLASQSLYTINLYCILLCYEISAYSTVDV